MTPEHLAAARKVAGLLAARLGQPAPAVKLVDDVVQGYYDDLNSQMMDVIDGDASRGDGAKAHRSFIKRDALAAYLEGMADGGIEDPEAEITDAERAVVKAWIADQLGYVADFWAEVAAVAKLRPAFGEANAREDVVAPYNAALRALSARLLLWESALRELAGQGKAAALKNMMVTWKLGATEEHCGTCSKLDGKRRRLKWFTDNGYIPQQNDSETLDCGGWRCLCELRDDKNNVILPA